MKNGEKTMPSGEIFLQSNAAILLKIWKSLVWCKSTHQLTALTATTYKYFPIKGNLVSQLSVYQ